MKAGWLGFEQGMLQSEPLTPAHTKNIYWDTSAEKLFNTSLWKDMHYLFKLLGFVLFSPLHEVEEDNITENRTLATQIRKKVNER